MLKETLLEGSMSHFTTIPAGVLVLHFLLEKCGGILFIWFFFRKKFDFWNIHQFPEVCVSWCYHVCCYTGSVRGPFPSYTTVMFHYVVADISRDLLFYLIHRALHLPWLYKHIHKRHHEYFYSGNICYVYLGYIILILSNYHMNRIAEYKFLFSWSQRRACSLDRTCGCQPISIPSSCVFGSACVNLVDLFGG